MRRRIRLSLLILTLMVLLCYGWITISSNPKRAASGEFVGLVLLTCALVGVSGAVGLIARAGYAFFKPQRRNRSDQPSA
jgi:hypothetical protein